MSLTLVLLGLAGLGVLAQTTWLAGFTLAGARPDIALIILTFGAHAQGVQRGQISGFAAGVLEDILSVAPLGFHALVRLAHSAVVGLAHGNLQADPLLTPMLLVGVATLIKFLTALLTGLVLGLGQVTTGLELSGAAVELGFNIVAAPILFGLLRALLRPFLAVRGGYR